MSSALEGPERRAVTLAEQANSSRLRRSTFIGHSAGYLLILGLVAAGLAFAGFTRPVSYDAVFTPVEPPLVLHLSYTGLNAYATLALAVVAAIIWTDLTVRRRHDRGRSGTGAVIWQMLFVASVIIHSFAEAPDIVGYVDAALVLGGLYLFVVLVLPGTRGANRYGPPPELD